MQNVVAEKLKSPFEDADELYSAAVGLLESSEAMEMSHSDLERELQERGRELIRQLLDAHLELRGPGKATEQVRDSEGELVPPTRVHRRKLRTSFGDVEVERQGYGAEGSRSVHPLDADLNLPDEMYSLELRRQAAWQASRGSFEEAQEEIERSTGVKIPKRQIEELALRAAEDFDAFYEERRGQSIELEPEGDILVVSFDGKGVVMLERDLRKTSHKPRKGKRQRRGRKKRDGKKRMATVATVYTIAENVRSPLDVTESLWPSREPQPATRRKPKPKPVPKKRPKPHGKRVWASLEHSPEEVMAEAFADAEHRDPEERKRWVALVDGEPHQLRRLRKRIKATGKDVLIVLDFFHVLERLWEMANTFYPDGGWECESWVRTQTIRVLSGQSSTVSNVARGKATRDGIDDDQRKTLDRHCNYLLKYKPYLQYQKALEIGAPIATGVIEGACRSLICLRMERTGARWSLAGAEAVLQLRALRQSKDFDEYWKFHESRCLERNHKARYKDGKLPTIDKPFAKTSVNPNIKIVK